MKLNLKKVISSIAALAITAGVLVAPVSASKFDDVADTAAYKQSVEELAALGIVQGDAETGLFRPEDNIARSEVTKLVVAAMGPAYMEAAAGATGVDTQFTDVPGSHWASGYISTGVANSFINGMGDGTFAPDANVTYAQVVKMVVAAMGYTTICEKNGGWPNGYLTTAANIGITSGLNIVGADTVVTRGQVAMLLDNAIKTPIVAIGSYDENYSDGSLSANLKVMDDITSGGNAEDYRTLLTENHNAYSVKGRITSTKKSNTKLDNGEVTFNIESAKNFDDKAYGSSYNKPEEITALYDGTDAEALLFSYAEALIQLDEDENWVLLSVTPTGSNKAVELPASLLDAETVADFDKDNAELDFYQAADSNKVDTYEFATKTFKNEEGSESTLIATEMYVNGVKYKAFSTDPQAAITKFIKNNPAGTVTLIDQTEAGKTTTDGKIDFILVDYYVDAVVSSVVEGDTYRIYLKDCSPVITKANIKVDTEDEDIVASYVLDGMEVDYTELAEGDVLSIAYDVTDTFEKSSFYNVLVSRNTVTGRVNGTDEDVNGKTLYKINGELYSMSEAGSASALTPGETYVLYLNVFGQYVACEEDTNSANLGIFDGANITTADELTITVIDTAGNKTTYDVKESLRSEIETKANAFYNSLEAGTNPYKWSNRKDLANRVIKYAVNADGYLTSIETVAVQNFTADGSEKEYKADFSKLGSYAIAEDATVIDLSANTGIVTNGKATKISVKSLSELSDGVAYGGIAVDKSSVSGEYRLVIITSGEAAYTGDTAIAVYQGTGTEYDDDYGKNVVVIEAYEGGVYADEDTESGVILKTALTSAQVTAKNLVPGSVFLYQTNSDGYVDTIDVIYAGPEADYADFLTGVAGLTTTTSNGKTVWSNTALPTEWAETTDNTKSGNVEILFGAVSSVKNKFISVAQVKDFTIGDATVTGYDIEAAEQINIAEDANIYVYDYSFAKPANRLYIGGQVLATNAGYKLAATGSDTKNIVPLYYEDGAEQTINFIFAKVVDDVITECLVILGK